MIIILATSVEMHQYDGKNKKDRGCNEESSYTTNSSNNSSIFRFHYNKVTEKYKLLTNNYNFRLTKL